MQEHQERVVNEKNDLDAKLGKLRAFIGSEMFDSVPMGEQNRLRRQELIMELYSDVLAERISFFTE